MKTGYHVVDATGFDLSSPGKVDGIYAKFKTACQIKKPVFLENCVYSAVSYTPIPAVLANAGDSGIYIDTPNGSFTCSTADVISANV